MNNKFFRLAILFSAVSLLSSIPALALASTWVGGASGNWNESLNWSAGIPQAASDTATFNAAAAVAIPGSIAIKTLTVNAPVTLTIASGATLAFENAGSNIIDANADLLIDGTGDISVSMNGTTGTDYANIRPTAGNTVTFAARVTGTGIENNGAGTLRLTNPNNTYPHNTILTIANGIIEFTDVGALGAGTALLWGSNGYYTRYIYSGGTATLAKDIAVGTGSGAGRDITVQHAGTGALTISGNIYSSNNAGKAVTFDITDPDASVIINGDVSNGTSGGAIYIYDSGAGTLILNGTLSQTGASVINARRIVNGDASAATGATTVNRGGSLTIGSAAIVNSAINVNGGTLALENNATLLNPTLTFAAGATLSLNPSAADSAAITLPLTNILNGAGIRMIVPAADTASTVTIPNPFKAAIGATLDVAAPEIGTARNTILVQNLDPGPLPSWFTVNGLPAAYDAGLGLIPATATGPTQPLAALGHSTIQNDPTSAAIISTQGSGGGIDIAADPTAIFSLTQDHAGDPAIVGLGGKTLAASLVAVTATGNSLTLENGTLTAPSVSQPPDTASLPALSRQPIAWYDLADVSTVTTDTEGRITRLANKGSSLADLDATVPADCLGPLYIPDAVATGFGVARSDATTPRRVLASVSNAGITGTAPRTIFAVTLRSTETGNNLYSFFLGGDAASQSFAFVERPSYNTFMTHGNDINTSGPSPAGLNTFTFISGLDDPNDCRGFFNGIPSGNSSRLSLNTTDNPIHILNRPSTSGVSGPGDFAEGLVFDYTLSDAERAAVETYLMYKWQITDTRENVTLSLRNDSAASVLTADTVIENPYGAALALSKSGAGNVILSGDTRYTGATLINDGTLTFAPPVDATNTLGLVTGSGTLAKDGPGALALSVANTYTGGTEINSGTLLPGVANALGTGPVTIRDNAAIDFGTAAGNTAFNNRYTAQGTGPDALGAIRNSNATVEQRNALKYLTLADDTAVYTASRIDFRDGAIDFGGHSLTVNGGGGLYLVGTAVSGVTDDTSIHIANGMVGLETSDFRGSVANIVSADPSSGVSLYSLSVPMVWTLQLADNAYLRASNGGISTNSNQWAGPVELAPGTARLNPIADSSATVTGTITGNGGLLKEGDGWAWLFNPANDYAGGTIVTQGALYAVSANTLGTGAIAVTDTGALVARAAASGSPDGWTKSEIEAIATASTFTTPGTTALGIDTLYGDFDFDAAFPYTGLKKLGPYTLALSGSASDLGAIQVYDGELDLTDTGAHNLHANSVSVGALSDATARSVLRLANATLETDDPGYNRAGPGIIVGDAANSRGTLHIGDNAFARGRLMLGNASGSVGAVYQTSGVVTNTSGTANDAYIGFSGHGYYCLDSGELAIKGYSRFAHNNGSISILEQHGGSIVLNAGIVPSAGTIGDYYGGSFLTGAGTGIFMLSGGTMNLNDHSFQLGEWNGVNTYSNGYATLTLENDAQLYGVTPMNLANRNGSPQAHVNLNGGALTLNYFQKGGNNAAGNTATASINFNSGLLRVSRSGASSLVRTGTNNAPATLNVFSGGANIEILAATDDITLDQPLRTPANLGVASVTVTGGAGYIAAPAVTFSGGNGSGATAFAELDPATGEITGIRVTSPGTGYTSAPTVTLTGGGFTTAATATASLGSFASGGLTKSGPGSLDLTAANTYTGPTVVSNGTLRLGGGSATLSAATPITLSGGTLDLGGGVHTNIHPVTIESGSLINGTLSTPTIVKTGEGDATLAATPSAANTAAMYELFVKSLDPLVWYDPSDATAISVNSENRVTALFNKGSKPDMDAAIGIVNGTTTLGAPLLVSGTDSYSAAGLPMIKVDANDRGLASASNLGIAGSAPRTVVTVVSRESDTTGAIVCFGRGAASFIFEVGDRHSDVVIGGFDTYDLKMTKPSVQKAHVLVASLTSPQTSEAWRVSDSTENHKIHTVSGAFNTEDSRLVIGQRAGASGRPDFRGQVGETLVFDRLLTEEERTELMRLLVNKWTLEEPQEETTLPVSVTVAEGTLRLGVSVEDIARLAPAVWYDPSDSATTLVDGNGRVTSILNKGTRSAMDAVLPAGFQGPLLVTDAASYSAAGQPMLKIDSNTTGLASASNTGINGTAPRTVIGVMSRDASTDDANESNAVISFGLAGTRRVVELGDRSGGACFGTINDDLNVGSVLPAENASVYMMASTADNEITGWRIPGTTIRFSKKLEGNWDTDGTTPLCIGYRYNAHRANFRGQIGEVLLFDRLLTESERATIEAYLVAKWTDSTTREEGNFDNVTFDVAEGATLDLNGTSGNMTITGAGSVTNGTLAAGFVISPAGDNAIGTLALHGVTIAGAEYRLTIDGAACDRLFIDGDLSGLTVVPATDAEITGQTFVIATGAITEKPALSGFPSKFKLRQQGSDLILTSEGGTIMILK